MVRHALLAAAVATLALQPAATTHAQEQPVTYYDFTKIPAEPYGPYPETWAVVTGANSFVYGTVPAGFHQTPHRHNQEQFTVGVKGGLDYLIGGVVHRIGPHGVGLPPSNVAHGVSNDTGETVMMAEFQPVRRIEWLPPHPQVPPQPQSAEPAPLDAKVPVTLDFTPTSSDWRAEPSGARVKVLTGTTIRATFVDLSAARASFDLTPRPRTEERFVFVMNGGAMSIVGGARREVGASSLMVITPAARGVTLESLNRPGTELVVFDVIAR